MALPRVARLMPAARLLLAGEILLLAHDHMSRLEPAERRRVLELVARGHGRRRNLEPEEQDELAELIDKAAPRQFAGRVAQRLSPVPLPGRVVHGPRPRRR